MHHTRLSKHGLILSLLSTVALVAALILSVSLLQHASQAHAAGTGGASDGSPLHLVGPKQYYLALGDSLAYGFQPNGDNTHGYVPDLFQILQNKGTTNLTNFGCPGETSTTFINGGCPFAPSGSPAQLTLALAFLQAHAGMVSPVTLDIGANDVLPDLVTCAVNKTKFNADLATLNANLRGTILPDLKAALTINGQITGDLVLMNYYDPFQNICPKTVPFTLRLNAVLTADTKAFGFSIVNVFRAFGGAATPNPNICTYTWMCTAPPLGPNIHPTDTGYSVIANTFAAAILPD
jgi:lysophospholipase L1-like esterase